MDHCTGKGSEHQKMMAQAFKTKFFAALILTAPILALSFDVITLPHQLNIPTLLAFSTLLFGYGGLPFFTGTVRELKDKRIGMMTLVALAITSSYIYSVAVALGLAGKMFFWELATLIDIMLIGHYIEMQATGKASSSLEKLLTFLPKHAMIENNGELKTVPTHQLKPGDIIVVKPGEKIPVDGTIRNGKSSIDQSALTGESRQVEATAGTRVLAGSINNTGSLSITVTTIATQSYFSKVLILAKKASKTKTRLQNFADRAASWLTIIALSTGSITFIIWQFLTTFPFALERSITVMIITCPHSLGLAIPLVISVVIAKATKQGFIIKNIKAFEQAHTITTVAFDKTGTLTQGQLKITDIIPLGSLSENELIALAAALEQQAEHHISKAIVKLVQEKNIALPTQGVSNIEVIPGVGITGHVGENDIAIGNKKIIPKSASAANFLQQTQVLEAAGKTVLFMLINGSMQGIFAYKDIVRADAKKTIQALQSRKIKTVMLTGDTKNIAHAIAQELGIDKDLVFAECLPSNKIDIVKKLQNNGEIVLMVGDGINDAPPLAQANVSIAMHSGTDATQASADIALTANNLMLVPNAITLSNVMRTKLLQNLFWATSYNIIALPIAAGALAPWGIFLSPAIGAVLMTLSTVVVAINAMLIKSEPPK